METPPEPRRRHHTLITVDSHDWQDFAQQMRRIADDVERHQRISVDFTSSCGYYYQSGENDHWLPREDYEPALVDWLRARREGRA